MPDAESADELAWWAAALINPMPALGVCKEVRPMALQAADALSRVQWVEAAIGDSMRRMREAPHGKMEVEPPPEPSSR